MKWPWVRRARYDQQYQAFMDTLGLAQAIKDGALRERDAWMRTADDMSKAVDVAAVRYDALLEKYHALRVIGANAPEPVAPVVVFDEPDLPPDEVLAAIQGISPTRDKTYEANWDYWERNKARAAAHPDAFAEEIIQGAVFEPVV